MVSVEVPALSRNAAADPADLAERRNPGIDGALPYVSSVLVTGQRRRARWVSGAERARQSGEHITHSQMRTTQRVQRASDLLENLVRRVYYAVAILGVIGPIVLPFLRVEQPDHTSAWLALTTVTIAGAYLLLINWQSSYDED